MDVRRITYMGSDGARVFLRQAAFGAGGSGVAVTPMQKLLLAFRLGMLVILGVLVLVPLVALGVLFLVAAVAVGGAALLTGRLKLALKSLKRSDSEGRENVRVMERREAGERPA